ncbi:DUF4352 domain-containing protein [Rhodococcus sp. CH91]|uniref:DUF4352 domain-containing protein n=1 Tax=Rhodococcus sp. CH91 TaxID=2910256 RepID=UPI001F4AB41F|nr:DUF4352 domain-containing protein [Rhodococcus sp. CH91]
MTMPPQPPAGQQPYYPPPAQPQPQPKKRKKWPWILGAVLLIIVIVSVSGGGDEGSSDGSGSGSNGSALQDDAPAAGIGTEVRDGKFAFTVTNVETGQTQAGTNPYANKVPQGQFVFVHVDVKNIGDRPQSYFGGNQKLIDAQGREFADDTEAEIYANEGNYTIGEINPGNAVSVILVFDVPADAQPKSLELHDSAFSNGVTVNIG